MNWTHLDSNNTHWQDNSTPVITTTQQGKVNMDSIEEHKQSVMAQWEGDIIGWYQLCMKARNHKKKVWYYYLYRRARHLCKLELIKLYYPNAHPEYPMDTWDLKDLNVSYTDFPILPDPLTEIEDQNYHRHFPDDNIASPSDIELDSSASDTDDSDTINDIF